MPFDPTLPLPNSPLESQVIRDQLQSLFVLINAISPVTSALVEGVSTSNPGDPAQATVSLVGNELRFTFVLPRGDAGPAGGEGPQGPAGEVTNADLSNAIASALASTSSNSNTVNTMPFGAPAVYDPLTLQQMIDKVNELIVALRR